MESRPVYPDADSGSESDSDTPKVWTKNPLHVKKTKKRESRSRGYTSPRGHDPSDKGERSSSSHDAGGRRSHLHQRPSSAGSSGRPSSAGSANRKGSYNRQNATSPPSYSPRVQEPQPSPRALEVQAKMQRFEELQRRRQELDTSSEEDQAPQRRVYDRNHHKPKKAVQSLEYAEPPKETVTRSYVAREPSEITNRSHVMLDSTNQNERRDSTGYGGNYPTVPTVHQYLPDRSYADFSPEGSQQLYQSPSQQYGGYGSHSNQTTNQKSFPQTRNTTTSYDQPRSESYHNYQNVYDQSYDQKNVISSYDKMSPRNYHHDDQEYRPSNTENFPSNQRKDEIGYSPQRSGYGSSSSHDRTRENSVPKYSRGVVQDQGNNYREVYNAYNEPEPNQRALPNQEGYSYDQRVNAEESSRWQHYQAQPQVHKSNKYTNAARRGSQTDQPSGPLPDEELNELVETNLSEISDQQADSTPPVKHPHQVPRFSSTRGEESSYRPQAYAPNDPNPNSPPAPAVPERGYRLEDVIDDKYGNRAYRYASNDLYHATPSGGSVTKQSENYSKSKSFDVGDHDISRSHSASKQNEMHSTKKSYDLGYYDTAGTDSGTKQNDIYARSKSFDANSVGRYQNSPSSSSKIQSSNMAPEPQTTDVTQSWSYNKVYYRESSVPRTSEKPMVTGPPKPPRLFATGRQGSLDSQLGEMESGPRQKPQLAPLKIFQSLHHAKPVLAVKDPSEVERHALGEIPGREASEKRRPDLTLSSVRKPPKSPTTPTSPAVRERKFSTGSIVLKTTEKMAADYRSRDVVREQSPVSIRKIKANLFNAGPQIEKLDKAKSQSNEDLMELSNMVDNKVAQLKACFNRKDENVQSFNPIRKTASTPNLEVIDARINEIVYKTKQERKRSVIDDALSELENIYDDLSSKPSTNIGGSTEGWERNGDAPRHQQESPLREENLRTLNYAQAGETSPSLDYTKKWLQSDSHGYHGNKKQNGGDDDVFVNGSASIGTVPRCPRDPSADSISSEIRSSLISRRTVDLQVTDDSDSFVCRQKNSALIDRRESPCTYLSSPALSPTASLDYQNHQHLRRTRKHSSTPDPVFDDLNLRNMLRSRSNSRSATDPRLPKPAPSPTSADYLRERKTPPLRSRMRYAPHREADIYHDDMAYRRLRKDLISSSELPPKISSTRQRSKSLSDKPNLPSLDSLKHLSHSATDLNDSSSFVQQGDSGRRASMSKGISSLVSMFDSGKATEISKSAPDLMDRSLYTVQYDGYGNLVSEDPKYAKSALKPKKSLTPRNVKQRSEMKSRIRQGQGQGRGVDGYEGSESETMSSTSLEVARINNLSKAKPEKAKSNQPTSSGKDRSQIWSQQKSRSLDTEDGQVRSYWIPAPRVKGGRSHDPNAEKPGFDIHIIAAPRTPSDPDISEYDNIQSTDSNDRVIRDFGTDQFDSEVTESELAQLTESSECPRKQPVQRRQTFHELINSFEGMSSRPSGRPPMSLRKVASQPSIYTRRESQDGGYRDGELKKSWSQDNVVNETKIAHSPSVPTPPTSLKSASQEDLAYKTVAHVHNFRNISGSDPTLLDSSAERIGGSVPLNKHEVFI